MLPRLRSALVIFGVFVFGSSAPPILPAAEASRPKLVVLVIFDQLRADYLTRWDALFGEDGFHRLEKDGAWFQNCHYPYAHTVTAAGTCLGRNGLLPGGAWNLYQRMV
jgi:hypothetical protein